MDNNGFSRTNVHAPPKGQVAGSNPDRDASMLTLVLYIIDPTKLITCS